MFCSRIGQMLLSTTLLLLPLVGFCAATEYYMKPTIFQETSCPRELCYTLDELAAKYFYASATDVLMDNVTLILLDGTHELKGSIFVREVNDFTLLGAGGMNGESHVEINCKGVSSLVFDGITNLTITGITFSQCGTLYQYQNLFVVPHFNALTFSDGFKLRLNWNSFEVPHINALTFSDVFNLRLTWVVIQNSTSNAILAINVLGASVIDHAAFHHHSFARNIMHSHHIYIWYENCNQIYYNSRRCSNKTKSLLQAVNSHELHINNCVLRDGKGGSMRIVLYHVRYRVELDLMNITALNHGRNIYAGDISIDTGIEANYLVTLRDSYIGNSEGPAICVVTQHAEAHHSQLINITNIIIDKCAAGIRILYSNQFGIRNITTLPQIVIENCIIVSNSGDKLFGQGLSVIGTSSEHPQFSVVLRNVSFENNMFPQDGVISLSSVKIIELIDCRFVRNKGTPITLHESTLKVSGTLSFVNNTAYQGGGMAFYGESYMSVSLEKNTQILFTNNYAEHVGGAIFAEANEDQAQCFLQLATHYSKCSDLKNSHQSMFVFTNNTAHNGGDAVYCGSLHLCIAGYCKDEYGDSVPIVGAYIFILNYLNLVQYETGHHSNLSLISSAPSRVCLCENGEPDCLTVFANYTHYPGETFSISAIVVGQGFGTVDGTVYAQFKNKDTPRLEELQQSQQVKHSNCAKLKYTVFSANEKEMIILSTSTSISEFDPEYVSFVIKEYELIKQHLFDSYQLYPADSYINELLTFEVFINITLLPCPPGFMLSDQPAKCVCHTTLQLHNITCSIDDQTVHRGGTVWVGASFAGNKSNGVVVHYHCPFSYCSTAQLNISLDFPDTQCNFNRSGILCGGCRPGLSLALGTSQCLKCSNKHIALLIPIAIAGIVLVALIKLLNLTVSEGTLNGLIFYANIIGANQATFFPSTSTHCPVLTVFISWLDLDLGIETCFIDGLNIYWKTWLQFVFPAYIWIITAVITVVAHYSSTGAKFFGSNSVQVLATLFLLSYTKLLRTIITAISFTFLDYPDDFRSTVWLYDGNVQYLSPTHTPLILVALTIFLLLWLPYTMVLVFMQCIRKKSHHRLLCCFARLKPVFDAYFGPLKDKHCYWVGIMLLVRAVFLIISTVNPNNNPKLNLLAISGTTLLLLAYAATAGKVYKKRYVSFLENSFVFNLGALAVGSLYTGGSGQSHTAVVHTLVGIAFLQFVGIIIFHGYCSIKKSRVWRHCREDSRRRTDQAENRNSDYQPFDGEQVQPVRLRMTFNELREPVLEYADDNT